MFKRGRQTPTHLNPMFSRCINKSRTRHATRLSNTDAQTEQLRKHHEERVPPSHWFNFEHLRRSPDGWFHSVIAAVASDRECEINAIWVGNPDVLIVLVTVFNGLLLDGSKMIAHIFHDDCIDFWSGPLTQATYGTTPAGCRGGSRYVEGCWGCPHLRI